MGIVICSIPLIIARATLPLLKVHDEQQQQKTEKKREHNEMWMKMR